MNLEILTRHIVEAAQSAGEFIWGERNKVSEGDIETKSLNSLVSYVDKSAEEMLVKALSELLPEAGFIAEEGTSQKRGDRYNWIIDPLDGTTNFLHGIPAFAVSIALMDNDEIIAGVIYEIGQREMFSAYKNGGAYLNGNRIKVSTTEDLNDCLLATGFPYYDFSRMQDFLKLLSELFKKSRGVRRIGSAATDLAYVACGRFDAFFEYGLSPWDVAAGVLLVTEAGGQLTDYKGGNNFIFGGEILASSKPIMDDMLAIIQKYLK